MEPKRGVLGVAIAWAACALVASAERVPAQRADRVFDMSPEIPAGAGGYTGGLADLGDVDGDGWGDLGVSIERTLDAFPATGPGRVWIVSGRTGQAIRTLEGAAEAPTFGFLIVATPDITGDGIRDLLVTTRTGALQGVSALDPATGALVWRQVVVSGGLIVPRDGLNRAGDWNMDGAPDFLEYTLSSGVGLRSTVTGERIGSLPVAAGKFALVDDVDGDGRVDVIEWATGIPGIQGPSLRLRSGPSLSVRWETPGVRFVGAGVPDINADGWPDAVDLPGGHEVCEVRSGRDGLPLAAWSLPSGLYSSDLNSALSPAGDVNGDGTPDVYVVAPTTNGPSGNEVVLYSGRTGGVLRRIVGPTEGAFEAVRFDVGFSGIAHDSDFNGDGVPDVALRVYWYSTARDVKKISAAMFFNPPPCPADANYDRVIDFLDLNRLLSQFGQGGAAPNGKDADVNADGVVDCLDLNVILSAFGSSCGG